MSERPRVVCVTPVRNEAWILDLFLSAASLWADDIVLSDQHSDDASLAIAARFPKVRLVRHEPVEYDEATHRRAILAAARRLVPGPKVLVALDADELLAATVLESAAWEAALRSPLGSRIAFDWFNVRPGFERGWVGSHRPFAVVDDGAEYKSSNVFHAARLAWHDDAAVVSIPNVPVLHYQYVDWARMRSKQRWYLCSERVASPGASAVQLFRKYHHMDAVPPSALRPLDPAWLSGYSRRGVDPRAVVVEPTYRWDAHVLDLFDAHGARRFAREWIWDEDWVGVARARRRPEPARYADPRGWRERLFHRWLTTSQRHVSWRPMRAPDRLLGRLGW